VNGTDPCNYGNLPGVRDYVNKLGFRQTYYGQLYHEYYFKREVRRIHGEDPDARFVLVGFSLGANTIRSMAERARTDCIASDVLLYIDGNLLAQVPHDLEHTHIISIQAGSSVWWKTPPLVDADNLKETETRHFDSPTDPRTLEQLARALEAVAMTV